MSHPTDLRFPNGHTVEQVKRNAKRLCKEQGSSLSKALDQMASAALGLPENFIRWAEAIKAMELSTGYLCLPDEFSISQEAKAAFVGGFIVSIDIKDALEFKNTGPWIQDDHLNVLMTPTLIALHAATGAKEDGRKIPNEEDWEWALEGLTGPTLYRYTGSHLFKNAGDVVREICERNFFPPDDVWMDGLYKDLPNQIAL